MFTSADRSWLHPRITGVQAEQLLKSEGKVGSFLIRPSQSGAGSYSLSVRLADCVTHVRIHNDGECYDLPGSGGETFATLSDLIRWYMEGGGGHGLLKEKNGTVIDLRFPLPTYDHSTERFFHRELSGQDAEASLEPLKPGWFLVRKSKSHQSHFVLSIRTDNETHKFLNVVIIFQKSRQLHVTLWASPDMTREIQRTRAAASLTLACNINYRPTNERYSIGDGETFRSLVQLVNHYRSHDITDKSGIRVMLKQAVNMTKFRTSDIAVRVAQLEKVFGVDGDTRDGFWEEFEHLQNQEESHDHQFSVGKLQENRKKNRYRNILPYDHTRVKLRHVDPLVPGSDYINANYITTNPQVPASGSSPTSTCHKRTYIATQGCLPNTIADFWQMVWQENCSIIVMLTELTEDGKAKCAQYWPNEGEAAMKLDVYKGSLIVETVSDQRETKDWILRVLKISRESSQGKIEGSRVVYHYHFLEWPDKKVPTSTDAVTVLNFTHHVNEQWLADNLSGPLVVHCSAGIGRTGTYVTIDNLVNEIRARGNQCEIDVSKTIQLLRQCRPGLVQVWQQYRFIYIAIKRLIESQPSAQVVEQSGAVQQTNVSAPRCSPNVSSRPRIQAPLPPVVVVKDQSSNQKPTKPTEQPPIYENIPAKSPRLKMKLK